MTKLLVSIPQYGDRQLDFLNRVINEFKSYKKYDVTVSIHSTIPIPRDDVSVTIHDPNVTPTLLYKHRQEFVDKQNDYDLFLAADNDVIIKEDAIDTYMKYDKVLPINYCLGFISYEIYPGYDNLYFFHLWPKVYHQPNKFNTEDRMTGTSYITSKQILMEENWYFMLTNVCQQSWMLTKDKLQYAIKGTPGFLKTDWPVAPKETAYCGIFNLWCHADGIMNKVHTRNIEDLQKCLIHHLPSAHIGEHNKLSVRESLDNMATWKSLLEDLK